MRPLLLGLILATVAVSDAVAAPCPGSESCPYASVAQISAPAVPAEVRSAFQVAVGPAGAVWAVDFATLTVVRISPDGAVQGSIGAGVIKGFVTALAVSPATGDVYVAEGFQGRVLRFSSSGQLLGSVGAGTGLGQVTNPSGLAVRPGSGRVYVAEANFSGRSLQSFSGALDAPADESSASEFRDASQIAFDPAGASLWALKSSYGLSRFAVANLATPAVSVCPAGGLVGQCQLAGGAYGLTVDADGNVWVPDRFNNRIQRFDSAGANPVAYGAPGSGDLGFVLPLGIAADAGTILVSDSSGRLRRYKRDTLELLSTVGGPALGGLRSPGLAIAPDGSVLQQDSGASLIRRVGTDGSILGSFGGSGLSGGQLFLPSGIATDAGGNVIQVDRLGQRLLKLTSAGTFVWAKGPLDFSDPDRIANGRAVATASSGEIYVADANRRRIAVYGASGDILRAFGSEGGGDGQFRSPHGVVIDDGSAFVLDGQRVDVQRLSPSGAFQARFGTAGGGPGEFLNPAGIAADGRGSIYVLDAGNSRVQIFGRDGAVRGGFGVAGSGPGQFDRPVAIAADGSAVVVSETSGRVQRFALPQPPTGAGGPGGQPGVADRTAPKLRLRAKRQRLKNVVARGLRVSCATDERAKCRVSVAIERKGARRLKLRLPKGAGSLRLGRSKDLATGGSVAADVSIRLSAAARVAFARPRVRSVALLVQGTATDTAGNVGRATLRLTLRR